MKSIFFFGGVPFSGTRLQTGVSVPPSAGTNGDGFCWCFLHQGRTPQPCHHGPGSAEGFGIYCYFFFPSGAAGRKEQFKCKCCEQCRQCCAAPRPAMERWGGPMGGRTHGYMDGPMDIPMAPTYGAGIRLGFATRSLLQHCLALHFAETSR